MKGTLWLAAVCLLGGLMVIALANGLSAPTRAAEAKTHQTPLEAELLQNPGFESASGGTPDHWSKYGGTLAQTDTLVHGGSYAAQFDSSSTSTKWVFQVVTVTEGTAYVFSAWALKNDANIEEVYLRVSWYASADGSGSQISHDDSTARLLGDDSAYRFLTTGPITVPTGARSARARLVLNPLDGTACTAYFDDASFQQAGAPEPVADLSVVKTGPDVATPGSLITYHITLSNAGAVTATAVRVTDTLPSGVDAVTPTSPFTYTHAERDLVWLVGSIPTATHHLITITAHVAGSAAGILTNRVTATTTASETITTNNIDYWETDIDVSGTTILHITALHYHGYASYYDEAVRLMNPGPLSADLDGWYLADEPTDTDGAAFPPGSTLPPGDSIWCARSAVAFASEFGFQPDYETDDTDPAVPELNGSWPNFTNDGDECALFDDSGQLVDVLVYGDSTDQTGWSGAAVQPWAPSTAFAKAGQILYRKLDQITGHPVQDTNSADNWAQDPNDHINGRKAQYPGWDMDEFFQTARVTETADLVVAVAPDNTYETIKGYIESATASIHIEGYTFENAHLIDAVVDRAEAGVMVRVLLEGGEVTDQERWFCRRLYDAGGEAYFLHNDDADIHDRYHSQHAKFMVLDGQTLIVGSENFNYSGFPADDKSNGTWGRRGAFLITDASSVVTRAQSIFDHDLDTAHKDIVPWAPEHPRYGDPTPGFTPTYVYSDWLTHTVHFPHPLILTDTLLGFETVQSPENSLRDSDGLLGLVERSGAGDTILVEQLYEREHWGATDGTPATDPNPRLEAYIAAARNGASVRILLNGSPDAGSVDENAATRAYVNAIAQSEGLDLKSQLGDPCGRGIHNKMVLVWLSGEGGYAHVGSINGSEASNKINRELAVQVKSDDVYHYLARVFQVDWWLAHPVFLPLVMHSYTPPKPPVDYALISEVMYRPSGQSSGKREWVELHNPTGQAVDISGWHLGDAATPDEYGAGLYRFPEGTVLPVDGVIVIAQQAEDFQGVTGFNEPHFEFLIDPYRDDQTVPNMIPAGAWSGFGLGLGDAGDRVILTDDTGVDVDAVVYGAATYAGVIPHAGGVDYGISLERRPPYHDTNDCSLDFVPRTPPTPGSVPSPSTSSR
jgi:cardiolipin synthase